MGKMPMPRKIMGRPALSEANGMPMPQLMPQQNLSAAAPAESDNVVYSLCGTGVSPVMTHGQDAHATKDHGQDAHATAKPGEENASWVRRCGIADSRIESADGAGIRGVAEGWRNQRRVTSGGRRVMSEAGRLTSDG
jgi:hypothetical protein